MILSTCIWGERTTQEVITLSRDAMSECDLEVFKSEDRNVSRASDFERFSCAFFGNQFRYVPFDVLLAFPVYISGFRKNRYLPRLFLLLTKP